MKGRKPVPTILKIVRGNPGKRPLNQNEPQPRHIEPRCPKWLTSDGKKFWREIAPVLRGMGLFTEAERLALTALCVSLADLKAAHENVEKYGRVIKTPKGSAQPSPYIAIQNSALKQIRSFLSELGLSPASRSRIHMPGTEDDDLDSFLRSKEDKAAS